jgi:hypothetical protein
MKNLSTIKVVALDESYNFHITFISNFIEKNYGFFKDMPREEKCVSVI